MLPQVEVNMENEIIKAVRGRCSSEIKNNLKGANRKQ